MRIRIVFNLLNKGEVLPFFHQPLIGGLVRHALGEQMENLKRVGYTFSSLKGQCKVAKKGLLYYSNRVTIVLACRTREFLDRLYDGIFEKRIWELGNLRIEADHAVFERLPALQTSMQYVCLSPIALCDPEHEKLEAKRFIAPGGSEFKSAFYKAIQSDLDADLYQMPILFEPDMAYITKLREEDRKFARIFTLPDENGRSVEVRGYTLPFQLSAPTQVHETLLNEGIGCARHLGFGMLDVAGTSFSERIEPYRERVVENNEA